MRDALSIYDRMVSFCDNNLTVETVAENLNILDHTAYLNLTDKLIEHAIPEALMHYNDIVQKGFDGEQFISGLATHLRNLYLSKDPRTVEILELGERLQKRYAEQAKAMELSWLADAMELSNSCELHYKNTQNKRLHVELCLMQIASLHFNGEKRKLIPTSFFLQQKENKQYSAEPQQSNQVEEFRKTTSNHHKKKESKKKKYRLLKINQKNCRFPLQK